MAGHSEYYSVIARAISGLPGKTEEARGAVYELARTALQERLRTLEPPISETDLSIEQFALEVAIQRVETESRPSDTRHGLSLISTVTQLVRSVRDKLNSNIAIRSDNLKAAITAGLSQGLEFIQRTQLTATGQRIYNIVDDRRWITKYPQIRIAVGLVVSALVGIFLYWIIPENNREANSHSLIAPSELESSDVTLSQPPNHSPGGWEVKGAIKNNSPRTLTGLWLKVTVRDCPSGSACATIGEEIKHLHIDIPASQIRTFDSDLFSNDMLIPEKLEWSYQIVQTDAK
jgi:hypothetical protein